MAVDAFIIFVPDKDSKMVAPKGETTDSFFKSLNAFEVKSFSFDVENKTSIGSATSGAGGGKANFGQFKIARVTDYSSPVFFKNCALGAHYESVCLACRKSGGSTTSAGKPYLIFTFGVVFTTKIEWSGPGDEAGPEESITFAYGALDIQYFKQSAGGVMQTTGAETNWNQLTNKAEFPFTMPVKGS